MKKIILDTTNPISLTVTNDTYNYFFKNEDVLDEDSLNEIAEIVTTFENGFELNEKVNPVFDSNKGTVKIEIFIYKEENEQEQEEPDLEIDNSQWDGFYNCGGLFPWLFYFKIISKEKVKILQINKAFKKRIDGCDGEIVFINSYPWIKYKIKETFSSHSLLPIKSKRMTILNPKCLDNII